MANPSGAAPSIQKESGPPADREAYAMALSIERHAGIS